ncbi:cob(I)yrinic acid a,c-diamide adenosyltransferase [Denitratisoma sp. DHT3]|uniref:cob(I)yrinic acid a,c-diamide adenosyltransferase n=1 Tax=Denitratisoma sp. DHT3 TaxID=1981880 RepID=UPI0011989FEE|nr:cob(I)yrinic acid a,c-diamide adenosyltransferase [Denitratisoma sp. DHT3]QDX81750.1 cob(I)yrinic acid a,c-diamide adenosyltransferase [Denitratisoma sp. DHT3]
MSAERDQRHADRMARKKAVVDAAIARATVSKGLILVLTGNGKGKSSSAFGMVARALGHGMRVAVFQFIKGSGATGEQAYLQRDPLVRWEECGEGFTWETQSRERDIAAARAGWEKARAALADPAVGLVVLDEMTYLFKFGYLELEEVLAALAARPPAQHVVVTGRGAPPALVAAADTVSEIADVKHAFRAGVAAQPGIDQ